MSKSMAELAVKLVEVTEERDVFQKQCNGLIKIILALKKGVITADDVDIKGDFT